jgi:hypothetical protein
MEEEAIRVIKNTISWEPAMQNGKAVLAYHKQPVTFIVGKGDKNYRTVSDNNSNDDNMIFTKVEIEPQFPGGEFKFREYMAYYQKNNAKQLAQSSFSGSVIIEFRVSKEGKISDIKAADGAGESAYGKLAIDLIQKGPSWTPGMQNGRVVNAYKRLAIQFINGQLPTTTPWPALTVDDSHTPKISVADLRNASVYRLLQLPTGTDIVGYTFTIDTDQGDIIQLPNRGYLFSSRTKEVILQATPGKLITIDLIVIKENGIDKKRPSLVYEVTN